MKLRDLTPDQKILFENIDKLRKLLAEMSKSKEWGHVAWIPFEDLARAASVMCLFFENTVLHGPKPEPPDEDLRVELAHQSYQIFEERMDQVETLVKGPLVFKESKYKVKIPEKYKVIEWFKK